LGEYNKKLSQDEKYSHRLKMVRKKQNKRASKYSLDTETTLTHFGKKINDMSKSELRQAFVGSGDEAESTPFSYDALIANSKEQRAVARRQKMEAEAELEDLDGSFQAMFTKLERRDIDKDKLENSRTDGEDDLAFLARTFQMDNIKKAMAGDRTVTEAEKDAQVREMVQKSSYERAQAAEHNNDEDVEENDVIESDQGDEVVPESTTTPSSDLFSQVRSCVLNPALIPLKREKLIELARSTSCGDIDTFFKNELFDVSDNPNLVLFKIISVLFPLDHIRHSIAVPALKILETLSLRGDATLCHLIVLYEFLIPGSKYSPAFLQLAGRLYKTESIRDEVLRLVSGFCERFTREALYGPIQHFFPELLSMMAADDTPFVPLRLHKFKPVEVLSLEPAFHENGEEWNGEHKELRAKKKLEKQFKQEKRITAKEMRREALSTEAFHAIQKRKEKEKSEAEHKRMVSKMFQAEENYRQMRTDNGKDDGRRMKSNKKRRQK
jgi:hypothetical protein